MGAKRTKICKASSKDRISELPDDILSSILCQLPLEESVRSSILSHRWKYLWKTYAKFSPNMILDLMSMRANNYFNLNFHDSGNDGEEPGKKKSLWRERRNFVRWVERMMQVNYNNDRVRNSFTLSFDLSNDFAENIDQWINTAISKGVHNFNIDLSPPPHATRGYSYTFPCWLFTNETALSVKCLSLKSLELGSLDFKFFVNLVDLHLEKMYMELECLTKLLTDCPNLEKLSLVNIRRSHGSKVKISGPAIKLKHLRLHRCWIVEEVNIGAINLAKLEYVGQPVIFTFCNIPEKLLDVTVDFLDKSPESLKYALGLLSKDIPCMESLFLTVARPSRKDLAIRRLFTASFAKLKKLVLKIVCPQQTLWTYIPLLQASPQLHKLELHLLESSSKSEPMPNRFVDIHHDHLEEVMLTGFNGTCHEMDVVKYLLSNCKALKKIVIDSEHKEYDHDRGVLHSISNCTREQAAQIKRKNELGARRRLEKVKPCQVQIHFV